MRKLGASLHRSRRCAVWDAMWKDSLRWSLRWTTRRSPLGRPSFRQPTFRRLSTLRWHLWPLLLGRRHALLWSSRHATLRAGTTLWRPCRRSLLQSLGWPS